MLRLKAKGALVHNLIATRLPKRNFCAFGGVTLAQIEGAIPVKRYKPEAFRPDYQTEAERAWHHGRIRFFLDQLRQGVVLDPIEVTFVSYLGGRLDVVLENGHHRHAAYNLSGALRVPATCLMGYRVSTALLDYLTGERKTKPRSGAL